MSHQAYIAPHVEIMELIYALNVVRSAVFVVNFHGYSIQFLPKVIRNRIGSYFCGHMSTTTCEYITVHTTCILLRATKRIDFVPFFNFPGNPSTSCPNSFDNTFFQKSIFLFLALYLCTKISPLCLDQ